MLLCDVVSFQKIFSIEKKKDQPKNEKILCVIVSSILFQNVCPVSRVWNFLFFIYLFFLSKSTANTETFFKEKNQTKPNK